MACLWFVILMFEIGIRMHRFLAVKENIALHLLVN